jgi:hypothetical protein
MNPIADPSNLSMSFEEFQRKFYPKWCESQQESGVEESFGKDLARYSVHKHFPSAESAADVAKKRP